MSDIEIAQQATMRPIIALAKEHYDIDAEHLDPHGHYKAKLSLEYINSLANKTDGKLILVTAISPTPAGEGKTTTTVGLGDAMNRMGKKTIMCLREPSLGPCFGVKGGAAGGGYAQVVPMEDINLHFTGDFHAIGVAHNLLSALIDNHINHGNSLDIDPRRIQWKRVVDMNDRALRNNVIIQANTTIGSVGFGYSFIDGAHRLIPHNGVVVIEDYVEIGANSCVDRAKFGETRIGAGTKIDNLVQIAHNVIIGKCCLIVGQAGIAGSSKLGDGVILGGQAAVADNVEIGAGVMVGAQSGVISNIPPGKKVAWSPAIDHKEAFRAFASILRLPTIIEQVKKLSALVAAKADGDTVKDLEERIKELESPRRSREDGKA